MTSLLLLLSLLQGDVQLKHRVVTVAKGDVEWYFWSADAKSVIHGVRAGDALKIVLTDAAKGTSQEAAAGRWSHAAVTGDGKRVLLLGRLWNGDDSVTELEDGKLATSDYATDTIGWPAVFSPDGKRLAYPGRIDDSKTCVCIETLGTGDVKRLGVNVGRVGRIAWSPDGKWLAYEFGDPREVWILSADGAAQRNLTVNMAQDFSPTWSPDSRKVAFISDRDKGQDVYVITVEGGTVQRTTADGGRKAEVAWSPKDNWIVARTYKDMKWGFMFTTSRGDKVRSARSEARPHGPLMWSPKGDQLLYRSVLDTGEEALVVANPP